MYKLAGILITAIAILGLNACDNRPRDVQLRAKLLDIHEAFMDDREQRQLLKAMELVKEGADPNIVYVDPQWGNTYTLLTSAIAYGNLQQVADLLANGADPNLAADGFDIYAPPLCHMFNLLEDERSDVAEFIELMVDGGAEVNGCPAIGIAAAFGREDLVALLLDKGATLDSFVSDPEYTFLDTGQFVNRPIQAAAWGGNLRVLEHFLERGVEVEYPNAFILAAFESFNPFMVEKCLELTPSVDVEQVYSGILMSFPASDDDFRWAMYMDLLTAMKSAGYGLTDSIVAGFERKHPDFKVDRQILTALNRS